MWLTWGVAYRPFVEINVCCHPSCPVSSVLVRFFISIKDDAGWADNRYVAFGRISEGMDIVHKIERVKVDGGTNHPKSPVLVDDCGLL